MTKHSPHVMVWIDAMRNTDHDQITDQLGKSCDGVKGFCCLGLGSMLVPGIEMTRDETGSEYDVPLWFNNNELLAPVEFIMWLFNRDEEWVLTYFTNNEGYDVGIDWGDVRSREGVECRWSQSGLSKASGLNDSRFTFAQIADIVDYFGLEHDPAREGS